MPSPFPGMDPYLEDDALWPIFHRQFIHSLHTLLQPYFTDRYSERVKQRRYIAEETKSSSVQREHHEEYIEIRQRSDDRLISLIDVVSPDNKLTAAGRTTYLDLRRESKNANASLVEIDLVLQGGPLLEYSRDGLPHWDYAVTVTRSTHPDRYEIYLATLQKRLPRFRLPLAPDDKDTVFDLQAAFTRCYDQGDFEDKIDYRRDPSFQLDDEDRRWIDDFLRGKQLREPLPAHEEIARAAYFLWEQDGRTHGHDEEHWFRALERLKQ